MCYFDSVKNCRTELVLVFLSSYVNPKKQPFAWLLFCCTKRKEKAMTKSGKRYCDRCKKQMPKFREEGSNIHDVLSLGWKTKSGTVMSARKDICSDCMDIIDELLSGE